MAKLVLIGGGGFAKEVLSIAKVLNLKILGYYDDNRTDINLEYLGNYEDLKKQKSLFNALIPGIGAADRASLLKRRALLSALQDDETDFHSVISPRAIIEEGVTIAPGCFIGHNVVLSRCVSVDQFCIINTNAVVGHDSKISKGCVLAPCSFIGGATTLNEDCLIGPNVSVMQGLRVGSSSVISAGASVMRNVRPNSIVAPARSVKRIWDQGS